MTSGTHHHLHRTASRRRWVRPALAMCAIPVVAMVSGATAAADTSGVGPTASDVSGAAAASVGNSVGSSCVEETAQWGGFQVLDAAIPSFDTGVDVVPAAAGETLTIVGVSADGLDPDDVAHVVPVLVGGVAAVPGAMVAGGDVIVSTDGTEVLRVAGVTVVVSRCAEVAQVAQVASAAEAAEIAETPRTTGSTSASGTPTAEEAAAVVASLPVTGGDSWATTLLGAALVGAGLGLISFARRRPVA